MAAVKGDRSLLESFQKYKSEQLNELRKENEFCDLILKCEDGVEIRVHKIVVASASNYFKDMLTLPMKERNDECIPLPKINGYILEKIISFIYTNEFEEKVEDVEEIIKHAVVFQLTELIKICSLILSVSINNKTCLQYWRFAGNNLISDLENTCLAYIARKADHLFENSLLNDLSIEEMRYLLTEDRLHVECDEQKIFEHVWKWAESKVSSTKTFSEIFSEVVDLFHFSQLRDEFIFSRIFSNDALSDNGELLKKVAKLTNNKHKLQNKNQAPNRLIFPKCTTRRLLALGRNKIFTRLEEDDMTQKEKELRGNFSYTTFDTNFLLICGGGTSACEFLDPITQEWRKFPSMKSEKTAHACSYLGNKIYACGGLGSKSVEIFDLGRGEWYSGPMMISDSCNFGLTAVNQSLYAIGSKTKNVEIFDPRTLKWSIANSDFSTRGRYTRCVSIGPCIYCFSDKYRYNFDTRMNKFIDDEEIIFEDFDWFSNFCELDGYIYGIGYGIDSVECVLKLVQYYPDGRQGYEKYFGVYNWNEAQQTALAALYY